MKTMIMIVSGIALLLPMQASACDVSAADGQYGDESQAQYSQCMQRQADEQAMELQRQRDQLNAMQPRGAYPYP